MGPAYKETSSAPAAPVADDVQWREFFTDERLQEIIETALKNNRDLRVAALNVERARALYRIQRAELLPTSMRPAAAARSVCPDDLSGTEQLGETLEQYSADLGISFLGDRLLRPHPQPGRTGTGGIPRHGTGPPQRADPAGVRSGQRLPDSWPRTGKTSSWPSPPSRPSRPPTI